jgi:hypothetical protein
MGWGLGDKKLRKKSPNLVIPAYLMPILVIGEVRYGRNYDLD